MLVRGIVMLVFGGFGLFMLYMGATQFLQQRILLATAQPVDAEIVVSQVRTSTQSSGSSGSSKFRSSIRTSHAPEIQFSYQFQGVSYQSDMIYPTIIGSAYGSFDSAQEELKPFPAGAHVKAYVSGASPDKTFLKAQPCAGPLVFMIIGLALPPISWLFCKLL